VETESSLSPPAFQECPSPMIVYFRFIIEYCSLRDFETLGNNRYIFI
jgi:hypothetical protein